MRFFGLFVILFALTTAISAHAQDQLTYEGHLTDDNGVNVPDGTYSLRFQIRSNDANDCLLHEETKSVSTENGQFIAHLNDGTGTVTPTGILFKNIFTSNTLSPNSCTNGSSTVGAARVLKIYLDVAAVWTELGTIALTTSPFAFRAHQIGPFSEAQLLRTDMGVSAPQLDNAQVSVLTALLSGTYSGNAATATTCSSLSGTLAVASGGTGATTPSAALNNILPSQSGHNGKVLQTDGTNASWVTPSGGGGSSPLVAKGDLYVRDAGTDARLPAGADGKFLKADSSQTTGLVWGDAIATDISSLVTTGIVQRNGAGSYSTVTVNAPLTYAAGSIGVDTSNFGDVKNGGNTVSATMNIGTNSAHDLAFETNGSSRMVILNSNGNVGIGTPNPTSSLDIVSASSGMVNASLKNSNPGGSTLFRAANDVGNAFYMGSTGTSFSGGGGVYESNVGLFYADPNLNSLNIGTEGTKPLKFYTSNTMRMTIGSGGNVGIGTLSPSEKLEVVGKVKAQELCIGSDCRAAWSNVATTSALNFYVSPGGNDSNPGTLALPFLTIQRALDAVPQKVLHPVTINISAGTYSPATTPSGFVDSWLLISKDIHYQSGGFLSLIGFGGTVQLQNANGWQIGLTIARPAQGVRLEGFSVSNFSRSQIVVDGGVALIGKQGGGSIILNSSPQSSRSLEISNGGQANLENVTISGFSQAGLSIQNGSSRLETGNATINSSSSTSAAVQVGENGDFEVDGGMLTVQLTTNSRGIEVDHGSFSMNSPSLNFTGVSGGQTLISGRGANISLRALPTWGGSVQSFLSCRDNSSCTIGNYTFTPTLTLSSSATNPFVVSNSSTLNIQQSFQLGTSVDFGFDISNRSSLLISFPLTTGSINGQSFIRATGGSSIQTSDNTNLTGGSFNKWIDLSGGSSWQSSGQWTFGSSVQANSNFVSLTSGSSARFDQNFSIQNGNGAASAAFLVSGGSSALFQAGAVLRSTAAGSSALRVDNNSTAEFYGEVTTSSNGGNNAVILAESGGTIRFSPKTVGSDVSASCQSNSGTVGFRAHNQGRIIFADSSNYDLAALGSYNNCAKAIYLSYQSRFELPSTLAAFSRIGSVEIESGSAYSKGGIAAAPAPVCSPNSICD